MVDWILDRPASALYAEMGLGKTVATLTAVRDLLDLRIVRKVLVIAPLRVAKYTWPDEISTWDHLSHTKYSVLCQPLKKREIAVNSDTEIHFINPENVVWLVEHFGAKWPYDMVVLDESSLFKSQKSRRFKALRRVRRFIDIIVELTGTPSPNGLLDLWSQVFLLDSGERLGKTWTGFRFKYFDGDFHGYKWTPKDGTAETIHTKLSDICLTLKSADYLTLPDRLDVYDPVELPPAARKAYKDMERDFLTEIADETVTASTAAVKTSKLCQLAQGSLYFEDEITLKRKAMAIHDAKADALAEIMADKPDENVLVAYQFKTDLERLRLKFPDAVTLDEVTPDDWNAGTVKMLLVHPQSAGHGLNLQKGGRVAVWYGLPWSLELYQQFNARLHRSGQEHVVFIHHIYAKDTVDETILAALDQKDITQTALLNALKRDAKARL